MEINEQFPKDHLMLNPETAYYQNQIGNDSSLITSSPVIDLNPFVENAVNKVKNWWEDLKVNTQQNQAYLPEEGVARYEPVIDLNPFVENAVNKVKNWWEDLKVNTQQNQNNSDVLYPALEQPIYETIATQERPIFDMTNLVSSQEDLEKSRIHEELAEKTKQISKLETANKKKDEKISELESRIEKLEKNSFLNWFPRALDDSKDERVF